MAADPPRSLRCLGGRDEKGERKTLKKRKREGERKARAGATITLLYFTLGLVAQLMGKEKKGKKKGPELTENRGERFSILFLSLRLVAPIRATGEGKEKF